MERPAWWHERSAAQRSRLAAGLERLRALLPALPEIRRVLVFGSYARDEVGPTSDLDLIVIVDSDLPQMLRTFMLYPKLRLGAPFDAIVYTESEFARLARTRGFVARAVSEGFWLDAA